MAQAAMEDAKAFLPGKAGLGPRCKVHAVAREDAILLHPSRTPRGFGTIPSWNSGDDPARIAPLSTLSGVAFIFPAVSNA
jgi:hypothetical protein